MDSQILTVTGTVKTAPKSGETDGRKWKVVSVPVNHYDFKTKTPGSTVWYSIFVNEQTPVDVGDTVTITGIFDIDQIKPAQKENQFQYTFPSFNSFLLIAEKPKKDAAKSETDLYQPLE